MAKRTAGQPIDIDSLQTDRHNLPAQLTTFIGREREVEAVCTLLQQPEVRIVTLTGTGGVGKTRLGLQVATELLDTFPDGVFFVSLAPMTDPDLVIPAIAESLEIREIGGRILLDLLKAYLHDKCLLLLDNFEQVLAAAVQVTDLLTACSQLKLLVTSRATLHVRGEQEYDVPPLAVPDPTHLPDLEALSQYEAVELFLQRARAVKPGFRLNDANATSIAQICNRLDGLPLAIELAAARSKLLPPQALLTRLEHRLAVLTGGARDAPVRQQTLRDTIAWSFHLLDDSEQQLFRRIAVFVGGCTLEAVEAICVELGDMIPSVLDGVESLLDKNLVRQTAQEVEEPRLMMLETIREYGLEALESSGEMASTRQAHAAYYLALAEEAAREYTSSQQVDWLERLEREHSNLRATMEWVLAPAQGKPILDMTYRLGEALTEFWMMRGFYSEARTFLDRLLADSEGLSVYQRAKTLDLTASFADQQGDLNRAETLWQESLALSRELDDIRGIASALRGIGGIVTTRKGDYLAGHSQLEESLALYKEAGDQEAVAWTLFYLAQNVGTLGEYGRGYTLYEESLAIFRELRNKKGIAHCLEHSALLLCFSEQGDQATIDQRLEESLTIFRELGDKEGMAWYCWVKGWVVFKQGDIKRAHDLMEQALALNREMGMRWHACWALAFFGRIKAQMGDFTVAHALLEESLAEARTLDDWVRAFCLERLAVIVAAQGEHALTARLLSVAASLREDCGISAFPIEHSDYEPALAAARTSLGAQAFTAAWAEGRSMTFEQVLAARGPVTIPESVATIQSSSPPAEKSLPAYPDGLTAREVEVLRLLAQGLTDAQIAEQLIISPRTVNTHLTSIYGKIQVSTRSAATLYAIEHHLLSLH